jgi:hypothetical protein
VIPEHLDRPGDPGGHPVVWVIPSQHISEADVSDLMRGVDRARARHTGPGPFIVSIDGRSGAGKSGLALLLRERLQERDGADSVRVFHLEDLYPGWEGLAAGVDLYAGMLARLHRGQDAVWHAWDWENDRADPSPRTLCADVPLLITEGVGSTAPGHPEARPDFGVWLHLEEPLRRHRALRRDGEMYRPYWDLWAGQEERLFAL